MRIMFAGPFLHVAQYFYSCVRVYRPVFFRRRPPGKQGLPAGPMNATTHLVRNLLRPLDRKTK